MNLIQKARQEYEEFKETNDGLFKVKDYNGDGTAWLDLREEDQIKFYVYTTDGVSIDRDNLDTPKSVKELKREKAAEGTAKLSEF
jgi:hypothetical protein